MSLERVKDLQSVFKNEQRCRIAIALLTAALEHGGLWPDEVNYAGLRDVDANCIGPVYSSLFRCGVLETDRHTPERKSKSDGARGRFIHRYQLASISLAEAALRQLRAGFQPRQQELSI